ncbi:hypothetical protein THASP1DRAFT_29166 [Thamnocephalis sphaerospora]|uniref:Uncharacterized protein n=1 Tax=Thamnocephalis sphaerospora TaxID=78915 RepID=A0A4P9XSD8_9FUNG|nr:hypothetical protein THASP1DRAFT_29166 [Thamnocephalis sphaerospora]|eukprot:RKP09037.1 hypothetical protein THASP1DRAFT_29166 [Thamnocephalis sphaerospora]
MAVTQGETHQAIVWLMAHVAKNENQLLDVERRLDDMKRRHDRLEDENQQLRRQLAALAARTGVAITTTAQPTSPLVADYPPLAMDTQSVAVAPPPQQPPPPAPAQQQQQQQHQHQQHAAPAPMQSGTARTVRLPSGAMVRTTTTATGSGPTVAPAGTGPAATSGDAVAAAVSMLFSPHQPAPSQSPTAALSLPPPPPSMVRTSQPSAVTQHSLEPPAAHFSTHEQARVLQSAAQSTLGFASQQTSSCPQESPAAATAMTLHEASASPLQPVPERQLGSPWIKYGLDKGGYTLIRDYLRGTLKQTLVQDSDINGHHFHKTARLGDPVNITFRQAVTQEILALGELAGTRLPIETVDKRVSVYLQNYREESKKTPSELAADRNCKRLRSKRRREEVRQRRANNAAMQTQRV